MTWERYAGEDTGLEWRILKGRNFTPRFYCDDPTVGAAIAIYATKPPVCHLILIPRVQYLGQPIDWDISPSGSATSTINTYTINWGGATDDGNISGAAWSGAKTGDIIYNAVGTYAVEAYVTDVLSQQSQHVKMTVEVVEPVERVYIATPDAGVYVSDNGADPAASNTGLSGDQLKIRSLRLHPAYADLPAVQQHVWICTADGVSYSTNGGTAWSNISQATLGTPENAAGDSPAPATADLDQIDLAFDPDDPRTIYLLRTTATRAWRYMSTDYGATWTNEQVGV